MLNLSGKKKKKRVGLHSERGLVIQMKSPDWSFDLEYQLVVSGRCDSQSRYSELETRLALFFKEERSTLCNN